MMSSTAKTALISLSGHHWTDTTKKRLLLAIAVVFFCLPFSHTQAAGGFTINFLPDDAVEVEIVSVKNNGTDTRTCIPGVTNQNGDCSMKGYAYSDYDTYFVYEITEDTAGNLFHHVIVGREADGFAQDSYTMQGSTPNQAYLDFSVSANMPDGGGFPGGFKVNNMDPNDVFSCMELAGALGCNPLANDPVLIGGAGQNPKKTLVRQVNTDAANGFSAEFLQDQLGFKPQITLQIAKTDAVNGDITIDFKADMTAIDFDTNTTTLATSTNFADDNVFVNNMTISTPGVNVDYDTNYFRTGVQDITAGKFIFTDGLGWVAATDINPATGNPYQTYANRYGLVGYGDYPIYQSGSYSYATGAGEFDHTNIDVTKFFDPAQNICGGDPFCPVLYSDPSNVDLYDPAAPTVDTAAPALPTVVNPGP